MLLNDGVGLAVSSGVAFAEGSMVAAKVSFDDTDRSSFSIVPFAWIASTSGVWLGTSRVSFIASEKRVFAMVISSVSNVSLDDRGSLSVTRSRDEINATVATSVVSSDEFSGLRVSCIVGDSNDAFPFSSLEDVVSKPTVSWVVVSCVPLDVPVVVLDDVSTLVVVGLSVLVDDESDIALGSNCGSAVVNLGLPGVVVAKGTLPCKRNKMSCAKSINRDRNVDVMTGACVVWNTSFEISVVD